MFVYLHFWKDTPPSVNHNMVDKIWLTSLDSFRHNAKNHIYIYIYWTPPTHWLNTVDNEGEVFGSCDRNGSFTHLR